MYRKVLIISFFLSLPVILYALVVILPTFDDWTYITSPCFDNVLDSGRLLPWNGYWRPFDAIIGSILGLNHKLFPAFNHSIVLIGHAVSTILIYRLSERRNLAAAFFFLSPGMLGAVLDIDSANQVYATCWGLASLLFYKNGRKWLWMTCVIIATLCKENGIMYCVIPPFLCYIQHSSFRNFRPYAKDIGMMAALLAVYGVLRLLLTPAGSEVSEAYTSASMLDHAKDIAEYIIFAWVPMDFEALMFPPTRCILLASFTFMLAAPFLVLLTVELWNKRKDKTLIALIAAFFIAGAPHLLTLVSLMHIYAGLPFAALIIGHLFPMTGMKHRIAATLFLVVAIFSDVHHWHAAYQSGLIGKEMAEDVIEKSKTNPQKVFVINVDNGEPKYSIFNVIPRDAFGWGRAASFYSDYSIAKEIRDTNIVVSTDNCEKHRIIWKTAAKLKDLRQYDAIWIVDGRDVSVFCEGN